MGFEPSRTRTCDPLVKRAVKPIPASHGSYDLLTFYTGCSRFGVDLVTAIHTCLPVFTSQICHKIQWEAAVLYYVRANTIDDITIDIRTTYSQRILRPFAAISHLLLHDTRQYLSTFQPSKQATSQQVSQRNSLISSIISETEMH